MKKGPPLRGRSCKEANTRWKEVAFQRVLPYNERIGKLEFAEWRRLQL